jgi:hypothetical protein
MNPSIQSQINIKDDGSYSVEELNKYLEIMREDGFEEVEDLSFEKIDTGDRIKYIGYVKDTNVQAFRSGGIVVVIDYTEEWLVFKSFGPNNYSLQKNNIVRLWVKHRVSKKKKNMDKEAIFVLNMKYKDKPYTASIGDTVVYYARDRDHLNRFKESKKYNRALETGKFKVV